MVPVSNYITKEQTGTPSSITRFDNAMAVQIGALKRMVIPLVMLLMH